MVAFSLDMIQLMSVGYYLTDAHRPFSKNWGW